MFFCLSLSIWKFLAEHADCLAVFAHIMCLCGHMHGYKCYVGEAKVLDVTCKSHTWLKGDFIWLQVNLTGSRAPLYLTLHLYSHGGGAAFMTAGLGSGEETITSATHCLVQRLVYTSRKQVSVELALICQVTLRARIPGQYLLCCEWN